MVFRKLYNSIATMLNRG